MTDGASCACELLQYGHFASQHKMKETLLQTCNLMYNVYKVRITDLTAYRDTSGSTDITATQDLSRSVMLHHMCIWHAQRALI